jgi:hypothetical protein
MATRGRENPQMRDHKEPMARSSEQERNLKSAPGRENHQPQTRQSEMPVSRGGINQESEHNKHNDPGQRGHGPQKMKPDQEAD